MRHFTGPPDLQAAILGREMNVPVAFDVLCSYEGEDETVAWLQREAAKVRARKGDRTEGREASGTPS